MIKIIENNENQNNDEKQNIKITVVNDKLVYLFIMLTVQL